MSNSWEYSYVGQLRKGVGHQKLIVPSTRALIFNNDQKVLYISRRGEDAWGMPAGSIELDESIYECMQREVREETGLEVQSAVPFAVYTSPGKGLKNRFGDEYQMFEFVFKVEAWTGDLVNETDETVDAKFFPIDEIPPMEPFWRQHTQEVLEDFKRFNGSLILK